MVTWLRRLPPLLPPTALRHDMKSNKANTASSPHTARRGIEVEPICLSGYQVTIAGESNYG